MRPAWLARWHLHPPETNSRLPNGILNKVRAGGTRLVESEKKPEEEQRWLYAGPLMCGVTFFLFFIASTITSFSRDCSDVIKISETGCAHGRRPSRRVRRPRCVTAGGSVFTEHRTLTAYQQNATRLLYLQGYR